MKKNYFMVVFLLLLVVSIEARGRGRSRGAIRRTHGVSRTRRPIGRSSSANSRAAATAWNLQSKPKQDWNKLGISPPKATAPIAPPENPKTVSDKFIKLESSGGSNTHLERPPAQNPEFNQRTYNSQSGSLPGNGVNNAPPAGNSQPNYGFNIPPPAYNSHAENPPLNYVPPPIHNSHAGNPQTKYGSQLDSPAYNRHVDNSQSAYELNVPPPAYNSHAGNPQANYGFNIPPPAYNSHAGNYQQNYGFNVPPPAYNPSGSNYGLNAQQAYPNQGSSHSNAPQAYNSQAGGLYSVNGHINPPAYIPVGSVSSPDEKGKYTKGMFHGALLGGLGGAALGYGGASFIRAGASKDFDDKNSQEVNVNIYVNNGTYGETVVVPKDGVNNGTITSVVSKDNVDTTTVDNINIITDTKFSAVNCTNNYTNGVNSEIITVSIGCVNNDTDGKVRDVPADGETSITNEEAAFVADCVSNCSNRETVADFSIYSANNSINASNGETTSVLVTSMVLVEKLFHLPPFILPPFFQ